MYYLYKCWQYKVHKVKVDKKRVKEMIAQDLPGKPRYPIFSAVAGLCHVFDTDAAEETEESVQDVGTEAEEAANNVSAVPSSAAPINTINTTHHTYVGQGAYMDGPAAASFIDLEANLPGIHNIGNNSIGKSTSARKKNRTRGRTREERERRKLSEQLVYISTA